jgi:hypothetical protein
MITLRLRTNGATPRLPRCICMVCYRVNCVFTVSADRRRLSARQTDAEYRRAGTPCVLRRGVVLQWENATHLSGDTQVGESRPVV